MTRSLLAAAFCATVLFAIHGNVTLASDQPTAESVVETPAETALSPSDTQCVRRWWGPANSMNGEDVVVGPATAGYLHVRYPYYSYRRPWFTPGPRSLNVNIVW